MSGEKEEILTDPVRQIVCAKCGKPLDVAALAPFTKFRCGHCTAVQTVPAKLGNFILLELLGRGGMGAVYRGIDQALGRPVAVKVMLRSVAANQDFFSSFKREARAAAALNHPNIVQVYALDEEKGQSYIVMELLSGGRLDHIIAERKRLDEGMALRMAIDVAEGLNAASRVGLIHDDIKPENILFDSKGVAKVVDFGLARFRGIGGPQTGQNEIWGTPYYIAPEKVLRKTPDFKSDMYSLGGTLFHALTGRPPFEGETAVDVVKARLQAPAPDVRTYRPELRPALAALIARMLEREPEKRFPSYDALLEEMRKLAGVEAPKPAAGAEGIPPKSTKILFKGKKKLSLSSSTPEGEQAAGAAEGAAAEKEASKRKMWPLVLFVVASVAVLGGLTATLVVMAMHHKAREASAARQAELSGLRQEASTSLAAIQTGSTGVLAGVDALFFSDVEATNRLAQARAILDAMGDQAKLVTLPVMPSEADEARRVEGPAVSIFAGVTNLESQCDEAAQLVEFLNQATPAKLPACRTAAARLKEIEAGLPPLAMVVGESEKTAAKVATEAKDLIRRAEEARDAGARAAGKLAVEDDARKKLAAEEAERKRLEAERKAKVDAEREKVRAAWNDNADKVRLNQFADAAESLKRSLATLETEDGQADAKAAEDRCLILQEIKDFLVAAIQEKPLRWGWYSAGGQIDISGANEQGIQVRGKTEPWTGVDVRQMLKFMEAYVKSDEVREKKGKRVWARLQLGAAVYCYLQGERAYSVARSYADTAIQNDSKLESEVKRLMPDLPKGS